VSGPPLVELCGAALTYPGSPPVPALRPADLVVHSGEYVAVVGPSGSGKSTLLNVLGLLDRPTAGRYRFDGVDTGNRSAARPAELRGRRIGFVFQSFHLIDHRSAEENVALGLLYRGTRVRERRAAARAALERVGLGPRLSTPPGRLSGGERQRVAIARALVGRPALLLCDEPTGNLDSASGEAVLGLIDALHTDGMTVIVVTHDAGVAGRANRIVSMMDGSLAAGPAPAGPGSVGPWREATRVTRPDGPARAERAQRSSDLVREAVASLLQRPARSVLTGLGIVLGIAAFVAVLGVTATAAGQISARFTRLVATEVTVEDVSGDAERTAFPPDAEMRVGAIRGARSAGVFWAVPARRVGPVSGVPLPGAADRDVPPVVAASPGLLAAVHGHLAAGRPFDRILDERAERVAVLGIATAGALGIRRLDVRPAVFLGGVAFTVIGVVDSVERRPELLSAVWVPRHTAEVLWGPGPDPGQPPRMVIDTDLGAAGVVAARVALALRPDAAGSFRVVAPPDPRELREQVASDLSGLYLLLAGTSLVIGAVGVANTTLVNVLERVPEIGLRRALGARRRDIAGQFVAESTAMGAIGGLVAAGLGAAIIVAVAVARGWTPVLAPWTVVAAPVVGGLTGLLAGVYPAVRASRIEPAEALRH